MNFAARFVEEHREAFMVDRAKDHPQATWFYAVCIDCDAKWFSARAKDLCPRCGQECSRAKDSRLLG